MKFIWFRCCTALYSIINLLRHRKTKFLRRLCCLFYPLLEIANELHRKISWWSTVIKLKVAIGILYIWKQLWFSCSNCCINLGLHYMKFFWFTCCFGLLSVKQFVEMGKLNFFRGIAAFFDLFFWVLFCLIVSLVEPLFQLMLSFCFFSRRHI